MVLDHLVIQRMDTTGRMILEKSTTQTKQLFHKEELSAILKFGAEELFKESNQNGVEDDNICDIDEILKRAETREDSDEIQRPGDELLSAFKVASFTMNEDEAAEEEELIKISQNAKKAVIGKDIDKDWDDIIPEDLIRKVKQEEKEREMAELYLPPRGARRGEASQQGQSPIESTARGKRKRKRGEAILEDFDSDSDSADDDSGKKPKKRGRPKNNEISTKFTDAQIRKFIKSFKKFPLPLERLDLIAKDAELLSGGNNFDLNDLKKLGELLLKKLEVAKKESKSQAAAGGEIPAAAVTLPASAPIKTELNSSENNENIAPTSANPAAVPKKPREHGTQFKLGGVSVNTRTLSLALDEMQPLAEFIPKDLNERKCWKYTLQ